MTIYYNDVDITDRVNATAAVLHDVSGGCCDYIELEFDNAALWLSWNPKTDDMFEIAQGDLSSGTMYVSCVYPCDGKFKVLATAIPSTARRMLNMAYRNMDLSGIMRSCANECNMGDVLFGIKNHEYDYLLRENESSAAFLERIATLEGAVLKCYNGNFTMIGIKTAQEFEAGQMIEQSDAMTGFEYSKDDTKRVRKLTVITPYGHYTAEDLGAKGNEEIIRSDVPAVNLEQVKRWARGLLLAHNRKAEMLTVRGSLNSGQTAMVRVDITGDNDVSGAWIADEVVHDFIKRTSTVTLLRCIDTVV